LLPTARQAVAGFFLSLSYTLYRHALPVSWNSLRGGGTDSAAAWFNLPNRTENNMADEKTTRGRNQDRERVAGGQGYEVEYFARKHGITAEQARQLIKEHGNNRATLDREAEKLKRAG
jgi:hypothetical protein